MHITVLENDISVVETTFVSCKMHINVLRKTYYCTRNIIYHEYCSISVFLFLKKECYKALVKLLR